MIDNSKLIGKVAGDLCLGYKDASTIRQELLYAGLNEYQAWLTYKAGELVYQTRLADSPAPVEKGPDYKVTVKMGKVSPPVSLTVETPLEPIQLCDKNDPPSLD